jgi:hypothetical protein
MPAACFSIRTAANRSAKARSAPEAELRRSMALIE